MLTVENAKAYFDPSTLITGSKKTGVAMHFNMPRLKGYFADFLQAEANPNYLQPPAVRAEN